MTSKRYLFKNSLLLAYTSGDLRLLAIFILLSGLSRFPRLTSEENTRRFTINRVIRWKAYTVFYQLFQLLCCWIHDVYPFFFRFTHQVGIKKPPNRQLISTYSIKLTAFVGQLPQGLLAFERCLRARACCLASFLA